MIKIFCNIDDHEFQPTEAIGQFSYMTKDYLSKKPDATVREIKLDLCNACTQAVRDLLAERQKATIKK